MRQSREWAIINVLLSFCIWPLTANCQETESDKLAVTAQEKVAIKTILDSGPGQRLVLKEFLPKTEPGIVHMSIGGPGPGEELDVFRATKDGAYELLSNMRRWNPGDMLSGNHENKFDFFSDSSNGAVVRFIGTVRLEPCTIDGSADDPLTFTWSNEHGLVYVHGMGTVKWADGSSAACTGDACSQRRQD
jgi:hypothetical protein